MELWTAPSGPRQTVDGIRGGRKRWSIGLQREQQGEQRRVDERSREEKKREENRKNEKLK